MENKPVARSVTSDFVLIDFICTPFVCDDNSAFIRPADAGHLQAKFYRNQ
jgi:hypothetical protein